MNLITMGLRGLALVTMGLGTSVAPIWTHDISWPTEVTFLDKPSGVAMEDTSGPVEFEESETSFEGVRVEFRNG